VLNVKGFTVKIHKPGQLESSGLRFRTLLEPLYRPSTALLRAEKEGGGEGSELIFPEVYRTDAEPPNIVRTYAN
jgi:hypothetical protein